MEDITYRGYSALVEFDPEDRIFTGRLAGIDDVVGFHADTTEGLQSGLREAVKDYIETRRKVEARATI